METESTSCSNFSTPYPADLKVAYCKKHKCTSCTEDISKIFYNEVIDVWTITRQIISRYGYLMLEHIIIGGGFAFAAASQPGPLQAFLLSRVVADGWRRTLPAAFAPLISDGPIAVLMLTILHNVTPGFESVLKGIGGVVFLYFAVKTFFEWRRLRLQKPSPTLSSPRTLSQAVIVNLFNPGPYLGWSLILGPLVLEAWPESPANAVALVVSFYLVMLFSLALFIVLVGTTRFLSSSGRQGLILASSFTLAGIAFYSLWSSLTCV